MTSSDSHIEVSPAAERGAQDEQLKPRDTWPSPSPAAKSPDDTDRQDTIPTPPPELGSDNAVVIPPLRVVRPIEPSHEPS
jgi:hypothetical protein